MLDVAWPKAPSLHTINSRSAPSSSLAAHFFAKIGRVSITSACLSGVEQAFAGHDLWLVSAGQPAHCQVTLCTWHLHGLAEYALAWTASPTGTCIWIEAQCIFADNMAGSLATCFLQMLSMRLSALLSC